MVVVSFVVVIVVVIVVVSFVVVNVVVNVDNCMWLLIFKTPHHGWFSFFLFSLLEARVTFRPTSESSKMSFLAPFYLTCIIMLIKRFLKCFIGPSFVKKIRLRFVA